MHSNNQCGKLILFLCYELLLDSLFSVLLLFVLFVLFRKTVYFCVRFYGFIFNFKSEFKHSCCCCCCSYWMRFAHGLFIKAYWVASLITRKSRKSEKESILNRDGNSIEFDRKCIQIPNFKAITNMLYIYE